MAHGRVALATIPVSLAVAALVLDLLGETFNAISFAGLAAAVAIVIDEAVVSAENVGRRLRRPRGAKGANGASRSTASRVLDATHEMRSPAGVCVVHRSARDRPGRRDGGPARRLLRAYGAVIRLAVGAAMLVALTLAPALSLTLFSKRSVARDSALLRALAPRYGAALRSFPAQSEGALIVVGVAAVVGLATVPFSDSPRSRSLRTATCSCASTRRPGHRTRNDADRDGARPRAARRPGGRRRSAPTSVAPRPATSS